MELPMQPILMADDEIVRFKANKVVEKLYEYSLAHGLGLNELIKMDLPREDMVQFYQLIGYSVSRCCGLRLVSEEEAKAASVIANQFWRASQEIG